MSDEDIELIHGSGNIFHDFGDPNADLEQARALLAARIIKILDDRSLTLRDAQEVTGVAAAEFSRIRNLNLSRFTLDRMIKILGLLDKRVEVTLSFHRRRANTPGASRAA